MNNRSDHLHGGCLDIISVWITGLVHYLVLENVNVVYWEVVLTPVNGAIVMLANLVLFFFFFALI